MLIVESPSLINISDIDQLTKVNLNKAIFEKVLWSKT